MIRSQEKPKYSDKFFDSEYEYRFVTLPRSMTDKIIEVRTQGKYLSEEEARDLGIIQSKGWVHYDYHLPEPHIILFKRLIGTNPRTGKVEKMGNKLESKGYIDIEAKKQRFISLQA